MHSLMGESEKETVVEAVAQIVVLLVQSIHTQGNLL